jgi:hypothetical protein
MTMILSPIDFDHLVQVVDHTPCGYRAECLCGWASRWTTDLPAADGAAAAHRARVTEATGIDETIVSLLDLQDDLADTIMWLAETWHRGLPALRMSACADRLPMPAAA